MAKNYFDKNGNYINVENLSLAEIYHRGYQDGSEDGLQGIRPKGKWLCEDILHNLYYCSECRNCGIPYQPFCAWCGADMRKGGAE